MSGLFEPVQPPMAESPTIVVVEEIDDMEFEPSDSIDDSEDDSLTGF